jgi:hypothetical protein
MLELFLFILLILSFLLAHIFNYVSYFAKISGKNIGFSLLGTSLSGIIIGLSQLSLLFFIPSISFLIEKLNLSLQIYLISFLFIFSLTALSMWLIFINKQTIILLLNKILLVHIRQKKNILLCCLIFWRYKVDNFKTIKSNYKFKFHKKMIFNCIIAYLAISSGFFVSYFLVIKFPEYRLTISSVSTIIHSVGTFFLLSYVDPKLNSNIDRIENVEAWCVINSFFLSRIISLIILFFITIFLLSFVI